MKVAALGGEPEPVTDLAGDAGFDSHRHPWFLPDEKHFLYLARGVNYSESAVMVGSLEGGTDRELMRSSVQAEYAAG